jgi:hypothetical protein
MTDSALPAFSVRQRADGTHELLLGDDVFWQAPEAPSGFPDWEVGAAAARAMHAALHRQLPATTNALSGAEVEAALDLVHDALETLKAFAKHYVPTPALELHEVVTPAADIVRVLQVRDPEFYDRILRGESSDVARLAKALPKLKAALEVARARAGERPSFMARLRARFGGARLADD